MKIKEECKLRSIAGENIVLMPGAEETDMTRVLAFNDTACWLWQQAEGREFTLPELASLLAARYDVDTATALADVTAWADTLRRHGLIL